MPKRSSSRRRTPRATLELPPDFSSWVHGPFLAFVCLSAFFVSGPWAGFHGVLFGLAGLLILLRPPTATLPRSWWLLAAAFALFGSAAFLPAAWFGIPDWRRGLENLGLNTGPLVVIQSQMAAEEWARLVAMLLVGLWLAGHRASPETLRRCALAFTLAVATYAVIARWSNLDAATSTGRLEPNQFGFFPNRNHTATYLAMGAICGLGSTLQSARDKRWWLLAPSLAATAICLWAIASWSISRAGVVLVALGLLAWLPLLGRRYLGRHGLWAVGLIVLTATGWFLVTESAVRERLGDTIEKASKSISSKDLELLETSTTAQSEALDFRIPVFLDTLAAIGHQPLTGMGAGQFLYVFPFHRDRTIVAQDAEIHHPENDWLWLTAELGIPAALALLTLTVLAFRKAVRSVLAGNQRALRSACLVAAFLVPLHGLFDVPGHRITLAWCATLLFSITLLPPAIDRESRAPSPWPFRFLSLALLAAALLLVRAQWLGGPTPATTAAAIALDQAKVLYQLDLAAQDAATSKGLEYQPAPADDKLEQALKILDSAKTSAPLNHQILRHEAFFALHFDDKAERIDRAFALDRALLPGRVALCLRQAETVVKSDPKMAAQIAHEALERSKALKFKDPHNRWSENQVRPAIAKMATKTSNPEFFPTPNP